MSEFKKNRAAKYNRKQKYGTHSKTVPQANVAADASVDDTDKIVMDESYPFRRRDLESNWGRYEEHKDEPEDLVDVSKDFSAIVSAPYSQGNYFQFKGDRKLGDVRDDETIENEMFKLDVNLLGLSLSTIPFHIRCNIDERYFSEDSLSINYANANKAKEEYEKDLKVIDERVNEKNGNMEEEIKADGGIVAVEDNVTDTSSSPVKEETENLEEWLDNILDV